MCHVSSSVRLDGFVPGTGLSVQGAVANPSPCQHRMHRTGDGSAVETTETVLESLGVEKCQGDLA